MFQQLLQLYSLWKITGNTATIPHLFGPPGCGKTFSVEQLAKALDVNLHILNVARISPLEIEGVQMPASDGSANMQMHLASFWSSLQEGDIVLFDEFLRGFPETYNALLDIITSRRVGSHTLPPVFFVAASNSIVTYDDALRDRLVHIPAPDPRRSKPEQDRQVDIFLTKIGITGDKLSNTNIRQLASTLLASASWQMYDSLNQLNGNAVKRFDDDAASLRSLVSQVQQRLIMNPHLKQFMQSWATYDPRNIMLLTPERLDKMSADDCAESLSLIEAEINRAFASSDSPPENFSEYVVRLQVDHKMLELYTEMKKNSPHPQEEYDFEYFN